MVLLVFSDTKLNKMKGKKTQTKVEKKKILNICKHFNISNIIVSKLYKP